MSAPERHSDGRFVPGQRVQKAAHQRESFRRQRVRCILRRVHHPPGLRYRAVSGIPECKQKPPELFPGYAACRAQQGFRFFPGQHRNQLGGDTGSQKAGDGVYGCSITDPCLGWEKTERLIYELADLR